jgi:hypothetical protein
MKAIHSKAPPALAPAAMIQMGLLGLLYTYKHPRSDPLGGGGGPKVPRA